MEKIVITGVGGPAGRASAVFFREAGFHIVGTDIVHVAAPVDELSIVPPGDSPEFEYALMRVLEHGKPRLFIPTVTEELPQAARLKERIRGLGVRTYLSNAEAIRIANDKYLTAIHLAFRSIAVPRTFADEDVRSAMEAGEILGYPFVAKPRVGRGGRGVKVYFSEDEAEKETRRNIVYQEFLGGEEYDVNLFAHPAGRPRASQILLKTSLKDGIVGNATGVSPVYRRDVLSLAVHAVDALNLEGPIDIDIRRDRNGAPKILDINARVGANVLMSKCVLETMLILSMEAADDGATIAGHGRVGIRR